MVLPLLAALACCLAGQAAEREEPLVRTAPVAQPPVIDGVIGADEWRGAAGLCGFGSPLDPRTALAYVAADEGNLYLAFRTEMPPDGRLVTTVRKRGANTVGDDSLELWFLPPAAGRRTDGGPRGQGYFQMIVNSAGAIFDRHHEPGYGLPPQAWNVNPVLASNVSADGYWEMEFAFPLAEFGIEKQVLPAEWRLRLVRNWRSPGHQAAIPQAADFADKSRLMSVVFEPGAPAVQVRSLGGLLAGQGDLRLAVSNPAARPADVAVSVSVTAGENTVFSETRALRVAAAGTEECRFQAAFAPAAANAISVAVLDTATGATLYRRSESFQPLPEHRWTMPDEFLTFALNFDEETLKARTSKGRPEPLKTTGRLSFGKGVHGRALFLDEGASLLYERQGNLTVPGAVSFWVQVNRDRLPNEKGPEPPYAFTTFWTTEYKQSGYVGIQDSVYGRLNLYLLYFPQIPGKNVMGPLPWEKGRWYHVAANLHGGKVELYLDGRLLAQSELERPLTASELADFVLGGANASQCAMDEFRLYSRTLTPDEVRVLALGEETVDGRIAFLPTPNALAVEALMAPDAVAASQFTVTVADSEKTVFRQTLGRDQWEPLSTGLLRLRRKVPLPELPEGPYSVWLQETKASGEPGLALLRRSFVVRHYEWENNTLGESEAILPPFTPLEVAGNRVSCVLRTYTLGELGLWQQVESLGQEILARPVALHVESAGKLLPWTAQPVTVSDVRPAVVRFTGSAGNEAMEVTADGRIEVDGLMRLTLSLTPRGKPTLDRVWLEVPVRAAVASLFHASGEHLRANPGGLVPPGEGVVWQSRTIPQPHVENFIPYVWVGGEERGICWAADWDRDWVHGQDRAAVELVRQDQEVCIRVNLINGPAVLDRPRAIEFGLEASPVKPRPEGWRDMAFDFDSPGRARFTILWGGSYGAHYGWASRYPLDGDWTFIRKLAETQSTGVIDTPFVEGWIRRVLDHPGQLSARDTEKTVRDHVYFGFQRAKAFHQRQPPGKLIPYSCACEGTGLLPEDEVYRDEWTWFGESMHSSASFRDYAVWYAEKMMANGMGGIYVDNCFTCAKFNWAMDEAYIGDDGEVHPSLGIWRIRELVRRLATMMYEKGHEPFVYVHMTNANLIPAFAFAQANLDWEWKYGSNDYQERFTPDYIRAVSTGRQTGTLAVVLGGNAGVDAQSPEYVRLTRTGLALVLPHQLFFYAQADGATSVRAREIISAYVSRPETKSLFYWENREVVQAPGNLLVTAHVLPEKLLLVIGNTGEGGTFPVELDPAGLGVPPPVSAVNAESGEPIVLQGNRVEVPLPRHDFALIEVHMR
jgi:hypothetical protein